MGAIPISSAHSRAVRNQINVGSKYSDVSELRELNSEVARKVGTVSGERELGLQHSMYLEKSWKQPSFRGEFRLKPGVVLLFSESQCQLELGVEGHILRLWSVYRH